MTKVLTTLTAVSAFALVPATANAAIISGQVTGGNSGGSFQELTPGAGFAVGYNNHQSPNLFGFDELQNVVLTESIAGIAAGTRVASHYVFFDPTGGRLAGNVTFSSTILGLVTTTPMLKATDATFGLSGVNYLNPEQRGIELANDSATFSGNQVFVNFGAGTPGDYIRVLTASAVPEPATWAMMLLGFMATGGALRARRTEVRLSYS
jgi:hypothetical protein